MQHACGAVESESLAVLLAALFLGFLATDLVVFGIVLSRKLK